MIQLYNHVRIFWIHFRSFIFLYIVQKPREQVADAEALLDITNSLVTTVKAHSNGGVTPSDFVSCLLGDFGQEGGSSSRTEEDGNIHWKDVGLAVSHVFKGAPGCCTM